MTSDVLAKYTRTTSKHAPTESEVRSAIKMRKILWGILAGIGAIGLLVLWIVLPQTFLLVATILVTVSGILGVLFGIITMASKAFEISGILEEAHRLGVREDE